MSRLSISIRPAIAMPRLMERVKLPAVLGYIAAGVLIGPAMLGVVHTDGAAITWLADIGKQVTIVTENREFAADCEVIHMYVLRKRFAQGDAEVLSSRPYRHPVTVITSTTVREIRDGEVVLEDKDFNRSTLEIDDVVTCHTRPLTGLFDELRAASVPLINAGDSVRPRNLYHAVKEGSAFGLAVDEHVLFNSNPAILNDLPMDVLAAETMRASRRTQDGHAGSWRTK